ncbi:MAG TPA: ParB/RepB/Spo0J family partition protein [Urbifossiella sp.]|jgi:ParB family chromosome partitioning protein|nr:ParB/RepB/Spo0J family partition protein [Urbifossiella sp.]
MDATATKPRLGRGLTALLGDAGPAAAPANRLPVGAVTQNPYQPRKRFDDDELASLTASVKSHGVLQPLVVRQAGDGFQLIAGERRLRAARAAGLTEVPVHVVAFDDQQVFEAALVENIQRSDLNPIEKAQGFRDYLDRFGMSQESLGAKLGLDRTTVSNLLGLLNLPAEVQDAVRLGQITLGHAKVLKGVPEADRQLALCRETILKNYSVHALELLVKQQKLEAAAAATTAAAEPAERPAPVEKTAHVKGIEDDLRHRLAVKIEIKVKAKDRGQIVIGFDSNDDFERIVQALTK